MVIFYKIWKKHKEIQFTKNEIDFRNRKTREQPPSPKQNFTNQDHIPQHFEVSSRRYSQEASIILRILIMIIIFINFSTYVGRTWVWPNTADEVMWRHQQADTLWVAQAYSITPAVKRALMKHIGSQRRRL